MKPHRKSTWVKIAEIQQFIQAHGIVSVRQVFYHLVVKSLQPNTFSGYEMTDELLNQMRFDGQIPFDSISDTTHFYGTKQSSDINEAIEEVLEDYRSDWNGKDDFPEYIEVWLEKEALADTVYQATNDYGVYLNVSGGRTKVSQVHSFIKRANHHNKPSVIIYLGDFDPTGLNIDENLEKQFEQQALYIKFPRNGDKLVKIIRVALTEAQIKTLPHDFQHKAKPKDPNYHKYVAEYGEEVWELDALPPDELQKVVKNILEKYRPADKVEVLEEIDKDEVKEIRNKIGYTSKRSSNSPY